MPAATYDLSGRTALVTGAAGDIGTAVARSLAASGAQLVLTDLPHRVGDLDPIAGRCRNDGAPAVAILPFDVTDPSEVDTAVAGIGAVHLLANVAGYQGAFKPVGDYPVTDIERVMAINVTGLMTVTEAVVRGLRGAGRRGAVVNLASMAGVGGAANMPAYAASKAAVIGFTKAAAKDLAPHGIRVNAVSPAFIGPGEMWDRQVRLQAETPSPYYSDDPALVEREMVAQVPLGRVGSVEEVARVVTWLLSEDSSYVTGENVLVTGGIV